MGNYKNNLNETEKLICSLREVEKFLCAFSTASKGARLYNVLTDLKR